MRSQVRRFPSSDLPRFPSFPCLFCGFSSLGSIVFFSICFPFVVFLFFPLYLGLFFFFFLATCFGIFGPVLKLGRASGTEVGIFCVSLCARALSFFPRIGFEDLGRSREVSGGGRDREGVGNLVLDLGFRVVDRNAAENEKGGGLRVTMITVAGTTTNDKRPKMTVETTCERNGCREMGKEDDNNTRSSASDLMQLEQQQNHHHPAASCFFTVPSSAGLTSSSTSMAMGTTANLSWKKATSLQPTKKLVIKPFKGGPKHKKTPTPQIPIKVPDPKSHVLLFLDW